MSDRKLPQEDISNVYELTSIRFGPIPGGGWSMAGRFFYRCSECGYLMQGGHEEEICSCGNLYRDVGRFGANTGDDSIEVFEARSRRTGEFA
jgi:hypothetical protein